MVAVGGDDARAFLPSMLQRIETEVGQVSGLLMTIDTEDGAFIMEFIGGDQLHGRDALSVIRYSQQQIGFFLRFTMTVSAF